MTDLTIIIHAIKDEPTYLDVNENVNRMELLCVFDEGVNIRGFNDSNEPTYFCEIDKDDAVEMAKTILHYYSLNP